MSKYDRRPGESFEQYMARMDETRARIVRRMRIGWVVLFVSLGVLLGAQAVELLALIARGK